MWKIPRSKLWACPLACLAVAAALAGSASAQQRQSDQDQQQQTSNEADRDSDSDSQRDQDSDRDQQDQQRDQQERQRDQQQRDQNERQRNQQSRQLDQPGRQWNESRTRQRSQEDWSDWPQPSRDQFGRGQQGQYDTDSERQSTQYGEGRDEQDAGLGVNIISDGGPGVVVSRVFPGTPADEMGMQNRDRITHVNGQEVRSVGEFVNRIRNMNPGDDVELDVRRNRDERTVRGELESREEALVLRNRQQTGQYWQQDQYAQRDGDSRQTSYEDSRGYTQPQGRFARGDMGNRLSSIEQQVNRLSREIEDLRFALREIRQSTQGQPGRTSERQAGYDEYRTGGYQDSYPSSRRTAERWDPQTSRFGEFRGERMRQDGGVESTTRTREGERFPGETRERQYPSGSQQRQFDGGRRGTDQRDESPGGETGEDRLRPQSNEQSNR